MADLRHGDCREVLAAMDAESVDAVVTDPPYELAFMGKSWDARGVSFDPETWRAAHRVLKPGGHLLAFGGTRTFHRIAVAIEDAGFEVRDCLSWLYGSGFPKSHNVGNGIGTALKPAWEPVIVARKPLCGTVAQNVAQHGTGGINVDACRIPHSEPCRIMQAQSDNESMSGNGKYRQAGRHRDVLELKPEGRWPANVALDECASDALGEPSRFFYVAKASRSERNAGLEGMPERNAGTMTGRNKDARPNHRGLNGDGSFVTAQNHHPTVKPVALMRWLVRLVTPPGGIVCDPFMGSGTTGIAAALEGVRFIGIEQDAEYLAIAERRIAHWTQQAAADDARQLALAAD